MQVLVIFYIVLGLFASLSYVKNVDGYFSNLPVKKCISICFLLFFVLFVSSRSPQHPGDTEVYLRLFDYLSKFDLFNIPDNFRVESGFLLLTHIISRISSSHSVYMLVIALTQVVLWYFCFNIWVARRNVLIAVVIFCSLFTSYNLGGNVLRQGIALPIAIISLKLLLERKVYAGLLLLLFASFFHKSVFIILACWIVSIERLEVKFYFLTFGIITVLSLTGLFNNIASYIALDSSSYSHLIREGPMESYKIGFRIDFWLLSCVPLFLYFLLKVNERVKFSNVIKVYLTLFSVFIIAFEIPYSDRVGIYLWSMIAILVPLFIGSYQFKIFNSEFFTIFLSIVLGFLFFQYYPVMNMSFYFNEII
ncbi:hypothetical protein BZG76_09720 [Salinivibrio sp. AR647]|uniref:EpsG family protein n=1 Tax=Salinivibrio sp. AR647 TaxID=1909438 RepID=UPI000984F938|nr:EpsG family protein [Salinivibrio sp. AR647]OOE91662.1 hypothetical protein BZG76_09720 [Salinivibrio sp. AR647]